AKKAPARKPAKPAASAASDATLREALAELRTTLTRGVVLTRERLNETLDDTVRRGRMTRDDAEELAASLVGIGRRQAQDLLADVTKRKRAYGEARALEVLTPSPDRIAPLADHPGAPWQVLPYERQLQIKAEQVEDALRRIGTLDGFAMEPIEAAGEQWRYR